MIKSCELVVGGNIYSFDADFKSLQSSSKKIASNNRKLGRITRLGPITHEKISLSDLTDRSVISVLSNNMEIEGVYIDGICSSDMGNVIDVSYNTITLKLV